MRRTRMRRTRGMRRMSRRMGANGLGDCDGMDGLYSMEYTVRAHS